MVERAGWPPRIRAGRFLATRSSTSSTWSAMYPDRRRTKRKILLFHSCKFSYRNWREFYRVNLVPERHRGRGPPTVGSGLCLAGGLTPPEEVRYATRDRHPSFQGRVCHRSSE